MEKAIDDSKMPEMGTEEMRMRWEAKMETWRAEDQRLIIKYQAEQQGNLEMFRSVITAGQSTLKSAILINGGGAVALLAFISSLWTSTHSETATNGKTAVALLIAMAFYVGGTLVSAIAAAFTYLAQYAYAREYMKAGNALQAIIWLSVMFGGYGGFAWASWLAYQAICGHFTG